MQYGNSQARNSDTRKGAGSNTVKIDYALLMALSILTVFESLATTNPVKTEKKQGREGLALERGFPTDSLDIFNFIYIFNAILILKSLPSGEPNISFHSNINFIFIPMR